MRTNWRLGLGVSGLFALVALAAAQEAKPASKLKYPETKKQDVAEDYHGTKVADPYRWLEDDNSPETASWVQAENEVTFGYLKNIPQRKAIQDRLTKLWNYERFGIPSREGDRYIFSRNEGLQNQSVMWIADKLDAEPRVLIDPNKLSADGTVALSGSSFTEDGALMAYGISASGSDWVQYKIRDAKTGADLEDTLQWIKFSGASWAKDGKGFFYGRYAAPEEGQALKGVNKFQKLYYHRVGDMQEKDVLIYERPDQPDWSFGAGVTEDGRFLILSVGEGTERKNRLFYRDLSKTGIDYKATDADKKIRAFEEKVGADVAAKLLDPKLGPKEREALKAQHAKALAERATMVAANGGMAHGFVELLNEFDAEYYVLDNDGAVFYVKTDFDAPRGRIIAIDTAKPDRASWKELIPQSADTLQSANIVNNQFVLSYLKDAATQVRIHDLTGKHVRDVKFPGLGTAGGFGGRRNHTETFYSFTSYNVPPTIYRYDMKTGESTVFRKPKVDFNGDDYEVKQVFYNSKDGTKVPMFITHKKGIKLDGNNPTLLYGYGGFNIPLTPNFSIATVVWMEMGGVYAVANLRGGGEYGKEWHDAGRLKNKQNVFDDFIAAGEWLIANKYTSSKKLAIQGGSNGGLLVGACMTQRPDLYGACIPEVGVMDMLRFQKFTIGWAWTSDYGSSENAEDFATQIKYSPLHNLKPGTKYPATMVTTADHDDRVVPAHSFKFAAQLQACHAGDTPVLIRIATKAGHGAGKPTSKIIEEVADKWAFLVKNLGMEPPLN